MPFLNAICFLLLFISSNIGLAGISFPAAEISNEDQISFEISEDVQELSQSILTVPAGFNHSIFIAVQNSDFFLSSFTKEKAAVWYVANSRFIVPGLTLTKALFPFHTFL